MVKVSLTIIKDSESVKPGRDLNFAVSGAEVSIHIPGDKDSKVGDRDISVSLSDFSKLLRLVFNDSK